MDTPEVVRPQLMAYNPGESVVQRQGLIGLPIPEATKTHVPIPHSDIVAALVQSLGFRNIEVMNDEYALSPDFMKMFGVMTLNVLHTGVYLALGLRNSHDKSLSLAITVGYRVIVCSNLMFTGDFQAVIARKHTKNFELADTIALAVEKMQRGFEPLGRQIDAWQNFSLPDARAKEIIYAAFISEQLPVPARLAKVVDRNYFEPQHDEFRPRTMWSLSNAFTSAFKVELDPIPQVKATAKLGSFLERWN